MRKSMKIMHSYLPSTRGGKKMIVFARWQDWCPKNSLWLATCERNRIKFVFTRHLVSPILVSYPLETNWFMWVQAISDWSLGISPNTLRSENLQHCRDFHCNIFAIWKSIILSKVPQYLQASRKRKVNETVMSRCDDLVEQLMSRVSGSTRCEEVIGQKISITWTNNATTHLCIPKVKLCRKNSK